MAVYSPGLSVPDYLPADMGSFSPLFKPFPSAASDTP